MPRVRGGTTVKTDAYEVFFPGEAEYERALRRPIDPRGCLPDDETSRPRWSRWRLDVGYPRPVVPSGDTVSCLFVVFALAATSSCTSLNSAYEEVDSGSTSKGATEPGTTDGSAATTASAASASHGSTTSDASMESTTDASATEPTTVDPSTTGPVGTDAVTTDGQACADDPHEEDDDRAQAIEQGGIGPGVHDGVLCVADPDWRLIEVEEPRSLRIEMMASSDDAELALFDDGKQLIDVGSSLGGLVTDCLPAGDYFVRVSAPAAAAPIEYSLALDFDPCPLELCCQAGPVCPDLEVSECVCLQDAFCCDQDWDADCVEQAVNDCGLSCG